MRKILCVLLVVAAPAFGQALNPAVNSDNIEENICVPGWTKTVRPPVSYTNKIKKQLLQKEGLTDASAYELDHVVPLALGGHPSSPKNLRLQPWDGPDGAHAKDVMEARMHRLVCSGLVTLKEARHCMATRWQDCLEK
ncbi:hypothetical protein UFOVP274_37 [uncultured Caudovirales phage]|uniref:HNHc domain containing protein n=1 Tax=uncultured Caudovirales phage TaxID=2100421 RepID=A0A6J5LNM6_9CAUD|nr:hypothetical protein UFOVP274_37 [uncultured Caudovirales phage]